MEHAHESEELKTHTVAGQVAAKKGGWLRNTVREAVARWRQRPRKLMWRGDADDTSSESSGEEVDGFRTFDVMPLAPCSLAANTPEELELEEGPEALVDSGAAHSVADPAVHFPGSVLRPSDASKKGIKYRGPGKEVIPNLGEIDAQFMTAEGVISKTTWQGAKVRKPLLAVSSCNSKGNVVLFDNEESFILSAQCPELKQIRALVQQAQTKIRLHQRNGTYVLKTWRIPKDGLKNKSVFSRPAR